MTIPLRKRGLRSRMPMGEARWLLGAVPAWNYQKGDCTHGSIVRWRHLIIHKSGFEAWQQFQEEHWLRWRNTIIGWHRIRGWAAPPSHLRGHKQERAWLARQRRDNPRGRYQVDLAARWGLERKFGE